MATDDLEQSMSSLSVGGGGGNGEDWDKDGSKTPQNSVAFPKEGGGEGEGGEKEKEGGEGKGKRSLSELLKLHAEKGTDVKFSPEEASRVAEVLGQWINSESSPYEGEDDFFSRSQDDLALSAKRSSTSGDNRPRGQSESVINK